MRRRAQLVRVWLLEHMPAGLLFQPGEWFLAFLCIFSGAGTLLSNEVESPSIQAGLPEPAQDLWGLMLVVGGIALLFGVNSIRRVGTYYAVTNVPIYRLGLRLLGASTAVYCACLISFVGWSGVVASVVPAAFSAMCAVRLLSIGGRS